MTATPDPGATPVRPWATVAFLGWTAFVWVGRIRNAVADPALDDGGRLGPLLLSVSFLVPAAVAAVLLARSWRRPAGPALRAVVGGLALWTVAVWTVRVADIAFGGDHAPGFVAVHAALGIVSVALGAVSARSVGAVPRRLAASPA